MITMGDAATGGAGAGAGAAAGGDTGGDSAGGSGSSSVGWWKGGSLSELCLPLQKQGHYGAWATPGTVGPLGYCFGVNGRMYTTLGGREAEGPPQ